MDMKRILQAMDEVSAKPVEGADSMAKFLRVVKEADLNQAISETVEYLPVDPEISAQLRAQSQANLDADGPKHQADAFIKFSSGMYNQSTLPKTMTIKPGVTLPVKFKPIKNMDGDVLANAIAANKLLPPDLQYSSAELSQVVGQDSTQEEDISFNGVTQHDNGDMSYQAGPLSMRKNKDGSSDTTATIGDTTARVQQNPIGVKTLTAQGPAADAINSTDASAQRKSVDPAKFAAFQKQLPANESISKFLSIVKQNDVSILNEGANPHKVALPVQMTMQHYQQAESLTTSSAEPSLLKKYFHEVESEVNEQATAKRQVVNQYARVIAERVLKKGSKKKILTEGELEVLRPADKSDNYDSVRFKIDGEPVEPGSEEFDYYYKLVFKKDPPNKFVDTLKGMMSKDHGSMGADPRKDSENDVQDGDVIIPAHEKGHWVRVRDIVEAPIDMDPSEPNNPTIYSHQKANTMSLKGRIMSARAQLRELAQLAESDSLLAWEEICKKSKGGMFMGLEQNLEQIRHGISELAAKRRKGGVNSRGIDKNIGEQGTAADPQLKSKFEELLSKF